MSSLLSQGTSLWVWASLFLYHSGEHSLDLPPLVDWAQRSLSYTSLRKSEVPGPLLLLQWSPSLMMSCGPDLSARTLLLFSLCWVVW